MKKVLFLSMLLSIAAISNAQRVYFMYLQSDNGAPFYVKMGDKIHSSSSIGYLVLPNLKDSSYSFKVGIPSLSKEEPLFNISVNNNDRGFLLKNFDKGLSLFDLNTLEIIPAQTIAQQNQVFTTRSDNFTKTLSQAANDPSLLMEVVKQEIPKEVAKSQEKKESINTSTVLKADISPVSQATDTVVNTEGIVADTKNNSKQTSVDTSATISDAPIAVVTEISKAVITESVIKDTIVQKNTVAQANTEETLQKQVIASSELQTPSNEVQEYRRSIVVRRSESSTSEGFGLTFIDQQADVSDTIRLLIPNPKIQFKIEPQQKQVPDEQKAESTPAQPVSQAVVNEKESLVKQKPVCLSIATDTDFKKLRKDMAAQDTDDDMIAKASKAFKSKCYSTEQIKNLSALFLSASGKYRFFDIAYTSVSDQEKFESLQSEISEEYYINRFKALIAK